MSSAASLPEVSRPEVRRRNSALRILYYGVCLLFMALILGVWWLYWVARDAVPQVDGKASVSGISSPVRIVRDEHGVPTIEASTLEDLFFAQGYVTAQDRLWQMDMLRRAAAGELSEIIGEATVKMDREERILGLGVAAEAAEKALPARDRAYFDAYARGVNAFIESHRNRLSMEFRLLKYKPKPWSVRDSMLVGARMVQDLNHYSYRRALQREKILAKLGPELTADLYVNSSWRDRPPTELRRMDETPAVKSGDEDDEDDEEVDPEGQGRLISRSSRFVILSEAKDPLSSRRTRKQVLPLRQAQGQDDNLLGSSDFGVEEADTFRPGSNNWVVSGQHTVSGKPLLSNDMHLDHQVPNLWFAAHLKAASAGFDVAGVTLPGVPFVIVGHNQRIGWGFTNVGPTVEDDFVEEFNAQGQYKTPAGWVDAQHRAEIVHVKGKPDVTFDVVTTRHGPIITELIPGETRQIALRWTLQDGMGQIFFDVDSAQNWNEFRKAFSGFLAPGQNVMYGDVDGHIGYQATGRVPIRAAGDGSVPVSGSDDAHEWTGWIPFDEMPRIYDPPSGILASANGRIAPDGYKYSISTDWDAPWRTERIYRVLESGKKFNVGDMLALQMDVHSTFDRFCADKFVYAVDHAARPSERAKRAADILRDWDGRMSADSAAPTIATRARQELRRLLLEPKLGAAAAGSSPKTLNWKTYDSPMSTVWLENVLTKQPPRWLPSGYSDYESLLSAAVENVVKQTAEAPSDLTQWKWGKNYYVDIHHMVLGRLPLIGRFTAPGSYPLSGSDITVKAVSRTHGASERLTWNFANFDRSTLNLVTGESGIFLSPYYMDQWKAWYGGSTFAFSFSAAALENHRRHEMTLVAR